MKIHHLAIWTEDIDNMRNFYQTYFGMSCGEKYVNPRKQYTSYFLSFNEGDCTIELMNRPDIESVQGKRGLKYGFAHIAISVHSEEAVDMLTERLREDGYQIEGEPRTTGDGYYESAVLDPEGNLVEIIA